jgi:predicted DNA-binding protein
MIKPDPETIERIKYLAIVGKALSDTYSDENLENGTDFFLAKDALNRFKDGIDKLELDIESRKGMNGLIEYLQKKIDRRMGYVGQ